MSQTPITITYSLEETLARLEQKIDKQSEQIARIEATLQSQQSLTQKLPDLAEKVGELKNWRSIAFLILGGIVGWIARNSVGNP